MLSTGLDFDPFEMPTSVQVFPHGRSSYVRNTARSRKLECLQTLLVHSARLGNWLELGKKLFDSVLQKGGIWHLYGHSWELSKLGLWRELEELLDYVSGHQDVIYVPNCELLTFLATQPRKGSLHAGSASVTQVNSPSDRGPIITLPESAITTSYSERAASPVSSVPRQQSLGPVFVVGMWRSGTSLLYALLNKHPQIAIMYEADLFLLRPIFWIPRAGKRWRSRWEFWNRAQQRHGIAFDEAPLNPYRVQTAMEKACREFADRKGAQIWGEKSPNYYDCMTRLAGIFTHARFIVIHRDPAGVCRSVINAASKPHSWFKRRGMVLRSLLGCKVLKTQCEMLKSHGVGVHEIQYEALVRDPEAAMVEVCRFLNVPFIPEVASLSGADRSAIYGGEHHTMVKGDRIVSQREHPDDLSPRLKRKIEGYVSLWREENAGSWGDRGESENHRDEKPDLMERVSDQGAYQCLRFLDFLIQVVYSFAPLSLLRAFRTQVRRRESAAILKKRRAEKQPQPDLL
jgi:hypothetical protein